MATAREFYRSIYFTVRARYLTYCDQNTEFVSLFVFGATAPSGPGPLIHEVSRSHTTTHHSRQEVGLLWTSDRPVAETST